MKCNQLLQPYYRQYECRVAFAPVQVGCVGGRATMAGCRCERYAASITPYNHRPEGFSSVQFNLAETLILTGRADGCSSSPSRPATVELSLWTAHLRKLLHIWILPVIELLGAVLHRLYEKYDGSLERGVFKENLDGGGNARARPNKHELVDSYRAVGIGKCKIVIFLG